MARYASAKEIGRRIREMREKRGLTGGELADKIGTDKGTISRLEQGRVGLSVERLQKIASALSVEPSEVLGLRANRSAA